MLAVPLPRSALGARCGRLLQALAWTAAGTGAALQGSLWPLAWVLPGALALAVMQARSAPFAALRLEQGRWYGERADASLAPLLLRAPAGVLPWLLVLPLRETPRGPRHTVLIWNDMAPASTLRALRRLALAGRLAVGMASAAGRSGPGLVAPAP